MTEPRPVVLFVSTGRCGTQWLATNLGEVYPDLAVVEHEPLGPGYRCRDYFRQPESLARVVNDPVIGAHLRRIDAVTTERTYVETGWPLFAAIPAFVARFGNRLRLVHLTRHPVPSALSHMVHKTYAGSPREDGYTRCCALDPSCKGAFQRHLAPRWDHMSPYEKTLFWWTEVHLYAEELKEKLLDVPFCRIRSEDLFTSGGSALERLAAFIGFPWRPDLARGIDRKVDRWHHRTDEALDWTPIRRYPDALALATRLGYEVDDVDEDSLSARYSGSPTPGWR
ncbi:MAG TPA: hypothetical protein VG929_09545 [Actinomycetota bacterium]|nr:hypothetical protein [Actinomycetota bacterium]